MFLVGFHIEVEASAIVLAAVVAAALLAVAVVVSPALDAKIVSVAVLDVPELSDPQPVSNAAAQALAIKTLTNFLYIFISSLKYKIWYLFQSESALPCSSAPQHSSKN